MNGWVYMKTFLMTNHDAHVNSLIDSIANLNLKTIEG